MLAKADEAVMKFLHRETEKMTQEYGHEEILLRARQVALLHTFIHIHTYIHTYMLVYIAHIYVFHYYKNVTMFTLSVHYHSYLLTCLYVCNYVCMYVCI